MQFVAPIISSWSRSYVPKLESMVLRPSVSGRCRFISLTLTLGITLSWFALTASAQTPTYKQDRALTDAKRIAALRRDVTRAVRSPNVPDDAGRKALIKYYRYVIINGMTYPQAWKSADQMPAWRRQVIGDLESCRSAATRKLIHDVVYRYAGAIVVNKDQPTYHPAAKYNALLLIGSLDERPAQGAGSGRKPAVPSARTRGLLVKYASDSVEELRVAAVIGLARHAKLLAVAGAKPNERIWNVFAGIVSKNEPPTGMSLDGHHWMQRIALEALGDMGNPKAASLILKVMNDHEMPLVVRCAAADAIGRLRYQQKPDAKAIVSGLGTVALEALTKQVTYLKILMNSENEPNQGFNNNDSDEMVEITRVRRELKYQINCVNDALDGLGNAVQTSAKTSLSSQLDAVIKVLERDNLDPKTLYEELVDPGLKIESAIKSA